jgi:hypothetical protein
MRKLRRITEAEVIAEFLKNEFYQEEFHVDRNDYEHLVLDADITNEAQNALRRALLFRRRGHMWREVPSETQWWEVQLEPGDLDYVRVFPRAQWRRIAKDSFLLKDIVERIRTRRFPSSTRDFIARVQALSYRLRAEQDTSSVLLIGLEEYTPLTILEGNHRLTAALLAGTNVLQSRFRVLCGFSERMAECCWYETNVSNLARYARHRISNLFYDKDADVARVLSKVRPQAPVLSPTTEDVVMDGMQARKIAPGSK